MDPSVKYSPIDFANSSYPNQIEGEDYEELTFEWIPHEDVGEIPESAVNKRKVRMKYRRQRKAVYTFLFGAALIIGALILVMPIIIVLILALT